MSASSNRKLMVGVVLIILVVVGGAYAVFEMVLRPPPPVPEVVAPVVVVEEAKDASVADAPERQNAVVLTVEGGVEKVSKTGENSVVRAGDTLAADDSLRTDTRGRAELAIGDSSKLTVTESTELKVRELTRAVHQVQLKRGRLVAKYGADGERVLRIEDEQGTAVAEAKSATFSILSNGQALAVATETGTVNLGAAGKNVDVGAGQQAVAQRGEAPSAATAIPASVLLKIARAGLVDSSLCTVVEGTVDQGSLLEVDGLAVPVDARGRFTAQVPRRAGQRVARVSVKDASGRMKEQQVACRKEAAAPPLRLKLNWKTDAG